MDFKKIIAKTLEKRVDTEWYAFCKSQWKLAWGLVVILLAPAGVGIVVIFLMFATRINDFMNRIEVESGNNIASAETSASNILESSQEETLSGVGGSEAVVFTAWWIPIEGSEEAYRTKAKTVYLEEGHERVRFDYSHPVPVEQNFSLELSLGGEVGGNFQFGRLSGWELTVGDGDFQTIAFRDGLGNLVKETNSETLRSKLKEKLKSNHSFLVKIKEERENQDFVIVTVSIKDEEFEFKLSIPEKWEERDDVYYGLIDYTSGENKTSVLSPDLTEKINHR